MFKCCCDTHRGSGIVVVRRCSSLAHWQNTQFTTSSRGTGFCFQICSIINYLHLQSDIWWHPLSRAPANDRATYPSSLGQLADQTCRSSSEIMHSSETDFANSKQITVSTQANKVHMCSLYRFGNEFIIMYSWFHTQRVEWWYDRGCYTCDT